ncbi:MAG: hypothetical protein FJ100_22745 [Deltaproteobacteria bacterium]|nr:hypothetical protein [Deltaproteobacteria bacterium]
MALVTTSKARRVRYAFTGDSAVELQRHIYDARKAAHRERKVRDALAELPADASEAVRKETASVVRELWDASPLPPAWVPLTDCSAHDGATVATLRPLSWAEDQMSRDLKAIEQMRSVVGHGLVAIDDDEAKARAFCDDPPAPLFTPLYHAIVELTWGNPQA